MQKIFLNGSWLLSNLEGKECCEASIPSCNYTDLFNASLIPNPIIEDNERKLQWISEKPWQYSREIILDAEHLEREYLTLVFEQIDTLGSVYVNEILVGQTRTAHMAYEFDIKRVAKVGKNTIRVVFEPPFKFIEEYQNRFRLPKRTDGYAGNVHVRFPQYHFGWDWGPCFVSCGITRNCYILSYSNRIKDVKFTQKHSDERVVINIEVEDLNKQLKPNIEKQSSTYGVKLEGEVKTPEGEEIEIRFNGGTGTCIIENPMLWWCNGLGDQPLYQIKVRLLELADNNFAVKEGVAEANSSLNNRNSERVAEANSTLNNRNSGRVAEANSTLNNRNSGRVAEANSTLNNRNSERVSEVNSTLNYIVEDSLSKEIGLRTIRLSTIKDKWGQDFCFILNGVRIFAKGANWIPTDIFITNTSKKDLERLIYDAKKANMNMIRVWGGGYYERDYFYELCDRSGILVWQDLMFACAPYEFLREDFLKTTLEELKYNVQRIRHHASLCLWCGNNEIESLSGSWISKLKELISQYTKYFYDIVPKELEKLDPNTQYWASSPSSGIPMKKYESDKIGDTHLWGVWHGLQKPKYYNKRKTRFCSEFGMQSMPSLNAIDIFASDYNVQNEEKYSLNSKVMKAHQKCINGNEKMKYYVNQMLWAPKRHKDYVTLTQIVQSECMETAVMGWRLESNRCNGALYWQLNDCWGCNSWSSIDYYGNYKATQYRAKHFYSDVCAFPVINKGAAEVVVINDTLSEKNINLKIFYGAVKDNKLEKIEKDINVKAMANEIVFKINAKTLKLDKVDYVIVSVNKGQEEIMRKTIMIKPSSIRKLVTENAQVKCISKAGDLYEIEVYSTHFSRFTELRIKGETEPFSDNFFDLYPGETKTITIKTEKPLDEIKKNLTIKNLNIIEKRGSRLRDRLEMTKIFLKPINFLSYIYRLVM